MAKLEDLDLTRVPKHVAIIMDGNGRWAKAQGMDRSAGHKAGIDSLHKTLEAAKDAGVKYMTVYSFSTENWNRPKEEVDALMNLIAWGLEMETPGMIEKGVRLQVIGDQSGLPEFAAAKLKNSIEQTKDGKDITFILALNYSSRMEIVHTMRKLAQQAANGDLRPEQIDEQLISQSLFTAEYPDPDLLIRTGGELRISNYLLWQISYSEFYFCDTLWPEFGREELYDAILEYQNRERRFGKTSEQVQNEAKNA